MQTKWIRCNKYPQTDLCSRLWWKTNWMKDIWRYWYLTYHENCGIQSLTRTLIIVYKSPPSLHITRLGLGVYSPVHIDQMSVPVCLCSMSEIPLNNALLADLWFTTVFNNLSRSCSPCFFCFNSWITLFHDSWKMCTDFMTKQIMQCVFWFRLILLLVISSQAESNSSNSYLWLFAVIL